MHILPVDILQERLQKASNDKKELEQGKNEFIVQLVQLWKSKTITSFVN